MKKTGLISLVSKLMCAALLTVSTAAPVWAEQADTIVVQAEDYTNASPKPTTGAANIDGVSETVLRLNGGQWLEYIFNAEIAGEYEMFVQSASKNDVGVTISLDGSQCPISVFPASGSPLKYSRRSVGTIEFEAGEHVLRIENADAVGIDKFEFVRIPDDGSRIKVQFEEYIEACDEISQISAATGTAVAAPAGSWLCYSVSVPEKAKYTLSIYVASEKRNIFGFISGSGREYTLNCEATGGQNKFLAKTIGEICLPEGTQTIKISNNAAAALDYFILEKSGEFDADTVSGSYAAPAAEYASASMEKPELTDLSGSVAVVLPNAEWLEYSLKNEEAEAYAFSVEASAEDGAEISISMNGEFIGSASAKTAVTEICQMYLPKGENVIRITASGKLILKSIRLEKLVPGYSGGDNASLKVEFEDYGPGGEGVDYHDATPGLDADYYINRGDDVEVAYGGSGIVLGGGDGEWWRYYVDIPVDGTYILTVSHASVSGSSTMLTFEFPDGTEQEYAIQPTGAWDPMVDDEVGQVALKAGSGVIKVTQNGGGVNWDFFRLEKINTDFDIYSVFAGEKALVKGRAIERGSDFFTAYCTDEIDTAALDNASAVIANGDKSLYAELSAAGNELSISLTETLDYNTEYTLTVSGLASKYASLKRKSIAFVTAGAENDSGGGSLSINDKNINYEKVKISGTVYSSVGQGISGREVSMSLTGPDGVKTENAAKAVSGSGGAFEISYTLPENSTAGVYSFTLAAEYADKAESAELVYVSEKTEKAIFDFLRAAGNEAEVIDWFEQNSQIFGITLESDLEEIPSDEMFYRHFVSADYTDATAFYDGYRKYLAFEKLNQGAGEMIEKILSDSVMCGYIGIDGGKSAGIVKNRTEFVGELAALPDMKTPEEYKTEYDRICNDWLSKEFDKTDVMPDVQSLSVYIGQGVNIPIAFTEEQSEITKVSYLLECDKSGLLGRVTATGISGSAVIESTDKNAAIIIECGESGASASLGTATLTAPGKADSFTLKVSGSVEYKVTNDTGTYYMTRAILPKEIEIKVSSKSANDGGGGGSSSVSSAGSSVSQIISPQQQDTQNFSFNDLESVLWAQESINYLLKKNIVSENEERLFYPNRNITREEFVKMIVTAVGAYTADAQTNLSDVNAGAWYYSYVASAEKYGIVYGSGGRFGVGENITRQDMAAIIYRTLEKLGCTVEADGGLYADDGEISDYAKEAVYCAKTLNIMNGVGDNRCAPKDFATRAMAARMIYEMLKAVGQ